MIDEITTINEVQDNWPLLLRSLEGLNNPHRARMNLSPEQLFQCAIHVVGKDNTLFVVQRDNKDAEAKGYGICWETTPCWEKERTLLIYIAYADIDSPHAIKEMLDYCVEWCRYFGFKYVTAYTRRINGAASRWFEAKHGFKKDFMVFTKEV